jgi:hypothetical protein
LTGAQHQYTQQVDFAQLKSELELMEKNDLAMIKAESDRLVTDMEKLKQRLREEITRTQAGVRLDLNLEKGRMREESSGQELKIKEVDTRIEQEIATLRTAIQASKVGPVRHARVVADFSQATTLQYLVGFGMWVALGHWQGLTRNSDGMFCTDDGVHEIPALVTFLFNGSIVQRRNDIALDVLTEGDFFKGRVGPVEVIVDNDMVTDARLSRIRDLGECRGKTSLDGLFAIGAASAQAATEGGHVGWGYEEVDGVQVCLLDLSDALAGVSGGGAVRGDVPGSRCRARSAGQTRGRRGWRGWRCRTGLQRTGHARQRRCRRGGR